MRIGILAHTAKPEHYAGDRCALSKQHFMICTAVRLMMYGYGDSATPYKETVDLVEVVFFCLLKPMLTSKGLTAAKTNRLAVR